MISECLRKEYTYSMINQLMAGLLLNSCGNFDKSLNIKNSTMKSYFVEMCVLLVGFTKQLYVIFLFSLFNVRVNSEEADVLAK